MIEFDHVRGDVSTPRDQLDQSVLGLDEDNRIIRAIRHAFFGLGAVEAGARWGVLCEISRQASYYRGYIMKQKKGRLVFENQDLGMAIVSLDGFFQEVSFSFAGILGYEPGDLADCHIREIFPDSQDNEELRPHEACRELRLQNKDGHLVWVNLFASTVFGSTGKPEYIVYYLQDISKNKKVVKDLTESQQLLQNAFDDIAFGMIIFNGKGKIIRINNFLCQLLGYKEEELKGKHFVDITHPDDIEISIESDRRLLDKEVKCTIYEKRYVHHDGTPIWVLISNSLMHDEKGQPYYFFGTRSGHPTT